MILESIPNADREVSRILKVAKPNFVVMKLLAGGHKKESKVSVCRERECRVPVCCHNEVTLRGSATTFPPDV